MQLPNVLQALVLWLELSWPRSFPRRDCLHYVKWCGETHLNFEWDYSLKRESWAVRHWESEDAVTFVPQYLLLYRAWNVTSPPPISCHCEFLHSLGVYSWTVSWNQLLSLTLFFSVFYTGSTDIMILPRAGPKENSFYFAVSPFIRLSFLCCHMQSFSFYWKPKLGPRYSFILQ